MYIYAFSMQIYTLFNYKILFVKLMQKKIWPHHITVKKSFNLIPALARLLLLLQKTIQ